MAAKKKEQGIYLLLPAVIVDLLLLVILLPFCLIARCLPGRKKIFMGTMHTNNWVYVAQALRLKNYEVTFAVWSPPANEIGVIPYDLVLSEKYKKWFRFMAAQYVAQYVLFCWVLLKFDIIITCFRGRIIDRSVLNKWLELPLLKLAGKKIILNTFGSDIMTPRLTLGGKHYKYSALNGYLADPYYKELDEKFISRNRQYGQRWADIIISAIDHVEYLQRVDVYLHMRCVDTAELIPAEAASHEGFKIVHAPNHPWLKGTEYLRAAVQRLQEEGKRVELVILQGCSHTRVLEEIKNCDLVADQFLIGAYSRFAIEGMALGRPVICYLREDLLPFNKIWRECPILNTDPDRLYENIGKLYADGKLKDELGKKGRAYIEKYHSLDYIGEELDKVITGLYKKD